MNHRKDGTMTTFHDGDRFEVSDQTDGDFLVIRTDGAWPCRCGETHTDDQIENDLADSIGRLTPVRAAIHADRDSSEEAAKKVVVVSSAQKAAASAMVKRGASTGRPVSTAVQMVANAKLGSSPSRVTVAWAFYDAQAEADALKAELARLRAGIVALAEAGEADGRGNAPALAKRLRALLGDDPKGEKCDG